MSFRVFINFSKKAKERIEKLKAGVKPSKEDEDIEESEGGHIVGNIKEPDEFNERLSRVIQLKMNKINEGNSIITHV
jgi:hypothetical protein